jgi:hypothetical protein
MLNSNINGANKMTYEDIRIKAISLANESIKHNEIGFITFKKLVDEYEYYIRFGVWIKDETKKPK